MKKFTKIIICLLLCVVSLAFVACDKRSDKEKAFTYPSAEDIVQGNGGYAVQKGNYLYYVNGFVGVEDEENTRNASFTHGALMLMKLDANGKIVRDEDNLLNDEYYITMSDRLCGFEATNLYISGDYLYFSAVCQDDEGGEKNGEWAKNRVDFMRIKLDKTSKPERVYLSETKYSEVEFEYYESNGNTFLVVYENGTYIDEDADKSKTIVRVDCNKKTSTLVKEDVSSAVLNRGGDRIFFVADDSENSKYTLNQYNVFEHKTTECRTWNTSAKVELVGDNYAYVTYTHLGQKVLKAVDTENEIDVKNYIASDAALHISEQGNTVIIVNGTTIEVVGVRTIEDADAESIKVLGLTNGSVVYLDGSNNLKIVSYTNGTIKTIKESFVAEEGYFDISSNDAYMYFYNKVGEHKYLHRIQILNTELAESEMVGVYIEKDADSVTTEE